MCALKRWIILHVTHVMIISAQSPVVRNLTVPHAAHQTSVVEILWTVVRVAKVLLEVLWRLVVAVGGVIQLHVGASLVRDAPTGLKIKLPLMLCMR